MSADNGQLPVPADLDEETADLVALMDNKYLPGDKRWVEFTAKLKPEEIDYKRLDVLSRFLTPIGKIEPARRTGASRIQQTRIVRAIKRARFLGLLPYTINDTR